MYTTEQPVYTISIDEEEADFLGVVTSGSKHLWMIKSSVNSQIINTGIDVDFTVIPSS